MSKNFDITVFKIRRIHHSAKRLDEMIVYTPFWKTLEEKNVSTYMLINKYKISSSTIARLRHNQPISSTTLDTLCRCLDCGVEEIMRYQNN